MSQALDLLDREAEVARGIAELDARVAELQAMKRTLQALAGDERPECPILDGLAAPDTAPAPAAEHAHRH